jgi:hypothetical protein
MSKRIYLRPRFQDPGDEILDALNLIGFLESLVPEQDEPGDDAYVEEEIETVKAGLIDYYVKHYPVFPPEESNE